MKTADVVLVAFVLFMSFVGFSAFSNAGVVNPAQERELVIVDVAITSWQEFDEYDLYHESDDLLTDSEDFVIYFNCSHVLSDFVISSNSAYFYHSIAFKKSFKNTFI